MSATSYIFSPFFNSMRALSDLFTAYSDTRLSVKDTQEKLARKTDENARISRADASVKCSATMAYNTE
jgi:hypothetical protein